MIASRSLSSGAHSRDPLARNNGGAVRALRTSTVFARQTARHVQRQLRDLAAGYARGLLSSAALFDQRAQGMPGARCARSRVCNLESTRVSHHGHTGTPGIPRAMVLTVSFVLFPVTGLVCHRRLRGVSGPLGLTSPFRKLDASVGASEPHDFAVRVSALRPKAHQRPPHLAPRS